jgi:hypothetical protein
VVFRRFNLPFWAAANGSGKAGPVPEGSINDYPSSPGPDPDSILDVRIRPETSGDIFLMSIRGKFQPKPLLVTPAYEGGPELSPDRHWILYQFGQALSIPNYDVTRDGRLSMLRRGSHGSNLRVAIHWTEEMKQILAAGGVR